MNDCKSLLDVYRLDPVRQKDSLAGNREPDFGRGRKMPRVTHNSRCVRKRRYFTQLFMFLLLAVGFSRSAFGADQVLVPQVDGDFWQIAGDPDLGQYTSPNQQPVDFAIWQAADGTWQLWSCIRSTKVPGKTRLFFHWQANKLTDSNWTPMGIAMTADPNFGEVEGGLQAPYVFKVGTDYYMVYGTWDHIALARSKDGKTFARQLMPDGNSGMFGEEAGSNTRDPDVIKVGSLYYLYYTAGPNKKGADFVRTSKDLVHWSPPTKVAYGGSAGDGPWSAECPFVYYQKTSGYFYLLRNQVYGQNARFSVYRSKNPRDFGKGNDQYLVETMPYAAPEIVESDGQTFLAVLLPSLKGIQIAKLKWVRKQ
jgi:predicted GH43/DUF377 family glycosyl hydrolase